MAMSKTAIEAMVHKARRFPCERDTLYNRIGTPKFKDFVTGDQKITDESFGQILNRTSYDQLSQVDLKSLALNADLFTLHKLADAVAGERDCFGEMRVTPASIININTLESIGQAVTGVHDSIQQNIAALKIVPSMVQIELSATAKDQALPEFDFLVELVWALKHSFPDKDIASDVELFSSLLKEDPILRIRRLHMEKNTLILKKMSTKPTSKKKKSPRKMRLRKTLNPTPRKMTKLRQGRRRMAKKRSLLNCLRMSILAVHISLSLST